MASRVDSAEKYNFVTEPDTALQCVICLEVAEEPWQHGKCGRLLCEECLEKLGRDKPCPSCRMEQPQYFEDNKSKREVKALPIKCANMERGCEWRGTVGTLEKHVARCKFSLVPCPKQCKDAGNAVQHFMRKNLTEHLKKDCPNRPHQCQHCRRKGIFAEIQVHSEKCPKKRVSCPNCCELFQQGDMEIHINTECPNTAIPCKFMRIGCEERIMRKEMPSHEKNDSLHLNMALDTVVKLNDTVVKLQDKANSAIIFSVSGYQKKKEADEEFVSPSFYTPHGYHMAVEVDANGYGDYEGTHVSVFSPILEGRYDNDLNWPFVGEVTLTLLNQLEDRNHHTMTMSFTAEDKKFPTEDSEISGFHEFIPHSALSLNLVKNTQYLKDDTLYFRASVEVADHKPWLQCKIDSIKVQYLEETLKSNELITFMLSQFQEKKEAGVKFNSPSFYTSPSGYNMAVNVYANGFNVGENTHVSVFAHILKGDYDAALKWPFTGKVTFTLLNQLEDKNHHYGTLSIAPEHNIRYGIELGTTKFIPHSALARDPVKNTQYLKDDTLYFRVEVEVDDHNPCWLQCTIKH